MVLTAILTMLSGWLKNLMASVYKAKSLVCWGRRQEVYTCYALCAFLFCPFRLWTVKAQSGASVSTGSFKLPSAPVLLHKRWGRILKLHPCRCSQLQFQQKHLFSFLNIYRFWNKQLGCTVYIGNNIYIVPENVYPTLNKKNLLKTAFCFQPATHLVVKKVNGVIIEFQRKCF